MRHAAAASSRSTVMRRVRSRHARARNLPHGPVNIAVVGIGHRLHDKRGTAADGQPPTSTARRCGAVAGPLRIWGR